MRINQRGFSLVEILVVTAMIMGLVLALSHFQDGMVNSSSNDLQRACEVHARSVIDVVSEETLYRQFINYMPISANRTPPGNAFTATRAVPSAGDYFSESGMTYMISTAPTDTQDGVNGGNGVTLRSHKLIQGTLRTLAVIYNDNAGIRCQFGDYAPLTGLAPPEYLERYAPQVQVQIRPYNSLTGASVCGATVDPRPSSIFPNNSWASAFATGSGGHAPPSNREAYSKAGSHPQPPNFNANTRIANSSTATGDVGIELVVQVNYTVNGATKRCLASRKFEYPADSSFPPPPDVARVSANTTWPNPGDCNTNPPANRNASLQMGYQTGTPPRGFQLICRDLSWQENWQPNPAPAYPNEVCIRNGAVAPNHYAYGPDPALQSFPRDNRWVPCDQLRQCGVSPSSVNYSQSQANTSAGPHILTLNYVNLPYGCVMNFEVVSVSPSGNMSIASPASGPTSPGNRVFLEDAAPGIMNQARIWRATCGGAAQCWDEWGYFGSYFYYTCRIGGCCVGAGCSPYVGPF